MTALAPLDAPAAMATLEGARRALAAVRTAENALQVRNGVLALAGRRSRSRTATSGTTSGGRRWKAPGQPVGHCSLGCRVVDVDSVGGEKRRIEWRNLQPILDALGDPLVAMRSLSADGWHLWCRAERRVGNGQFNGGGLAGDVVDSSGYVTARQAERSLGQHLASGEGQRG